ncbi:uncharacterized protein DKFZp434B061-like [Gallus gallus]|uniref:uncharacterized protein DKFZp434B061-like n=1 Tax=Gallus gallus TaxID=9031 RepID=UPI001AE3B690|nr:uncharacterized protein DKFZp434B061-like [Gallus gallus]
MEASGRQQQMTKRPGCGQTLLKAAQGSPATTRSHTAQYGTRHAELRDTPLGHPAVTAPLRGPRRGSNRRRHLPRSPPGPGPHSPKRRQPPSPAPQPLPAPGRPPPTPGYGRARRTEGTAYALGGSGGGRLPTSRRPQPRAYPQTAHPRVAEPRGPHRSPGPAEEGPPGRAADRRRKARCPPRPEAAHGTRGLRRRLPLVGSQVRAALRLRAAPPSASPGGQVREAEAGSARTLPSAASARRARSSVTPSHSGVPAARANGRIAVEARQSGVATFRQSPPCCTARGRALPAHVAGRRHKTLEAKSALERRDVPLRAWTEGTALLSESTRLLSKRKDRKFVSKFPRCKRGPAAFRRSWRRRNGPREAQLWQRLQGRDNTPTAAGHEGIVLPSNTFFSLAFCPELLPSTCES